MRVLLKIDGELVAHELSCARVLNSHTLILYPKDCSNDIVVTGISNADTKLKELFTYQFVGLIQYNSEYCDYSESNTLMNDEHNRAIQYIEKVEDIEIER